MKFLSPRWILSHLFVATLVVTFVFAGGWQLDRLGARKNNNVLIESRIDSDPASWQEIADLGRDAAEYRPVQLRGRYQSNAEILVANRSNDGLPGYWAWTVFTTDDGMELIVNRGFLHRGLVAGDTTEQDEALITAIDGVVVVDGIVRRGNANGRLASDDTQISRPDAALASTALGLAPSADPELYVQLVAQQPGQASESPQPVPTPERGNGPHLSYAFQWFTFALIGLVGYALVLRRLARGEESRGDVPHSV